MGMIDSCFYHPLVLRHARSPYATNGSAGHINAFCPSELQ